MTWSLPGADEAVSEVVGYILITGITITAITVVLLTSGPALDQVQSSRQHEAMVNGFQDLRATVGDLLSGAPAGSTPVWRAQIPGGSLSLDEAPQHMWVLATDRTSNDHLFYRGFSDGDNVLTLYYADGDGITDLQLEASTWDAATETTLTASPDQSSLSTGGTRATDVTLTRNGDPHHLTGNTTVLRIYDGAPADNPPVARAWFLGAGAIEWTQAQPDLQHVLFQNGALISDFGPDAQSLHAQPYLQPPQDDGEGGEHIFARVVTFNGSLSIGGRQGVDVLLSSEGNHVRQGTSDTARVQIYPPTRTTTVWERLLDDPTRSYTYTWEADPTGTGTDEPVAYRDRGDAGLSQLSFTVVETHIVVNRQGGT